MSSMPMGALQLVSRQGLLSILNHVLETLKENSVETASTIGPSIVQLLMTVWSTLSASVTENDIETLKDNAKTVVKSKKRKRESPSKESKKQKTNDSGCESDSSTDVTSDDEEENNDNAENSRPKILPPMFVREFLNCLLEFSSFIINSCPSKTTSNYLNLLHKVIEHIKKIEAISEERLTLRLTAMSSLAIKTEVCIRI